MSDPEMEALREWAAEGAKRRRDIVEATAAKDARIAELIRQRDELVEALRPFARAEHIVASVEMGRIRCVLTYPEGAPETFTLGDLKRAKDALAKIDAMKEQQP